MSELEHFEIRGGLGFFHPFGRVTLEQAVGLVTAAIVFAREREVKKLLVDMTDLTGFDPPSMADRYFYVKDWARAAGGALCIAMVARPEMIHSQKFGVIVAAGADLVAEVFESESEALAWLQKIG